VPDYREAIRLDPGPHEIEASSGTRSVRREVDLREGAGIVRIELSLAPPSPPPSSESHSALPTVAALSLGFGVVGTAVGATTGLIAMNKASGLKQECVGVHCPVADASRLDSARTFAAISTVGFAAAGVGLMGAVVLFVLNPKEPRRPSVTAFVGPTRAGFAGTF
jgi:hypothetical protein